MRFVGNYALRGLSPQTDGMPVIPQKAGFSPAYPDSVVYILINLFSDSLHRIVNRLIAFAQQLCNLGIFLARKVFFEHPALHAAEKSAVLICKQ